LIIRGTALQARSSWFRFSVLSLAFVIDHILLVALWSWGRFNPPQKWVPGIFHVE